MEKDKVYFNIDFFTDFLLKPYKLDINFIESLVIICDDQFDEILEVAYYMVKTGFINTKNKHTEEIKRVFKNLAYSFSINTLYTKKYELPFWIEFLRPVVLEVMSQIEEWKIEFSNLSFDIQYSKIPSIQLLDKMRIRISAMQMPYMMQCLSCLFMCRRDTIESEKVSDENLLKYYLPCILYQYNSFEMNVGCLPEIYGLSEWELECCSHIASFQLLFILFHEWGHYECNHVPGEKPKDMLYDDNGLYISIIGEKVYIENTEFYKEIQADLCAYKHLFAFGKDSYDFVKSAVIMLFNFYCAANILKSKMLNRSLTIREENFFVRSKIAKFIFSNIENKIEIDYNLYYPELEKWSKGWNEKIFGELKEKNILSNLYCEDLVHFIKIINEMHYEELQFHISCLTKL